MDSCFYQAKQYESSGKNIIYARGRTNRNATKEVDSPKMELLKLKEELKYQHLTADVYNEMINVAEEH